MKALVIGAGEPGTKLAEALRAAGVEATVDESAADPPERGEIATLAADLVRLEASLEEAPPDAVLLVDDAGDRALAAALVATKLLIPVAAVAAESEAGESAALLTQLADRKLSADTSEIRAWIESLPTLSEP